MLISVEPTQANVLRGGDSSMYGEDPNRIAAGLSDGKVLILNLEPLGSERRKAGRGSEIELVTQ